MDSDPPERELDALIEELDWVDAEHPDVAVAHDSGWTLSASAGGQVILENVEDQLGVARQTVVSRTELRELFRSLAVGDLRRVEAEDWTPRRSG
jgi:hypothetical protein